MSDTQKLANIKDLAKRMKCGLYVDYGTDISAAFESAIVIAGASREPQAVFTALYGVVNTLANIIQKECDAQNKDEQVQTDTHPCGQDADQDH